MELEVGQPGVCQNFRSPVLGNGGTAVEVDQRLIQPVSAVDTPHAHAEGGGFSQI